MVENKYIKSGLLMGILNNILLVILPFTTRTIIIHKLGTEYVGLGGIFTSILQVLSLTELGFSGAITYSLYEPLANKNTSQVNKLLSFYRNVYRLIGTVIVIIAIALLPMLNILIKGPIPAGINIYVLYLFYVINTVISYYVFSYKAVILNANQRYDVDVSSKTLSLLVQYIVQCLVLVLFNDYYLYILIIPFSTLIYNILIGFYSKRLFPNYYAKGNLSITEIKKILKNVGGAFFSKVGQTIFNSSDTIIISAFLGLSILGRYQNYYYIVTVLISIFAVIHNTLRPVIGNKLNIFSVEENWFFFQKYTLIYMWLSIYVTNSLFYCLQNFEIIWTGRKNSLSLVFAMLIIILFYFTRVYSLLTVYQEAFGIWWEGKFIPIISSILNISLNIFFINHHGLNGVIIASIISNIMINIPGYIYIIFKYLFRDKNQLIWFLKYNIKIIPVLVASMFSSLIFDKFLSANNFTTLIFRFIVSNIIFIVISGIYIFIDQENYELTVSIIKKVIPKNK